MGAGRFFQMDHRTLRSPGQNISSQSYGAGVLHRKPPTFTRAAPGHGLTSRLSFHLPSLGP